MSTICDEINTKQMHDVELHSIEDSIYIKCTDGQNMPSIGYVCADLNSLGISTLDKLHGYILPLPRINRYKNNVLVIFIS